MRFLAAMFWIVPAILAAPSVSLPRDLKEASLFIKFDKTTLETEVAVANMESQVLGQSCGKALNSGVFADFPISTDLDSNGAGNVTFGGQSYIVHELADVSGGITCTRMYSDTDSFVRCLITVPNSFQTEPLSKGTLKTCFTRGTLDMERTSNVFAAQLEGSNEYDLRGTSLEVSEISLESNVTTINNKRGNKRADCNNWVADVVRIGDGDPHQNYFNTQLSGVINCGGADSCSVGQMNSRSYAVSYTWGGTFLGWTSAGFSVTETTTTGNSYTCTGHTGQSLCVWKNTAHTAYSVRQRQRNPCETTQFSDRYVLVSPNANDVGSYYYCVVGGCRNQGDSWLDGSGRAGGP